MTRKQQDQQTRDDIQKLRDRWEELFLDLHSLGSGPKEAIRDEMMAVDTEAIWLERTLSDEPEDPDHFGIPIA